MGLNAVLLSGDTTFNGIAMIGTFRSLGLIMSMFITTIIIKVSGLQAMAMMGNKLGGQVLSSGQEAGIGSQNPTDAMQKLDAQHNVGPIGAVANASPMRDSMSRFMEITTGRTFAAKTEAKRDKILAGEVGYEAAAGAQIISTKQNVADRKAFSQVAEKMGKTPQELQHVISTKDHTQRGTAISKFKGLTGAETYEEAAKRMGEVGATEDAVGATRDQIVQSETDERERAKYEAAERLKKLGESEAVYEKAKKLNISPEALGQLLTGYGLSKQYGEFKGAIDALRNIQENYPDANMSDVFAATNELLVSRGFAESQVVERVADDYTGGSKHEYLTKTSELEHGGKAGILKTIEEAGKDPLAYGKDSGTLEAQKKLGEIDAKEVVGGEGIREAAEIQTLKGVAESEVYRGVAEKMESEPFDFLKNVAGANVQFAATKEDAQKLGLKDKKGVVSIGITDGEIVRSNVASGDSSTEYVDYHETKAGPQISPDSARFLAISGMSGVFADKILAASSKEERDAIKAFWATTLAESAGKFLSSKGEDLSVSTTKVKISADTGVKVPFIGGLKADLSSEATDMSREETRVDLLAAQVLNETHQAWDDAAGDGAKFEELFVQNNQDFTTNIIERAKGKDAEQYGKGPTSEAIIDTAKEGARHAKEGIKNLPQNIKDIPSRFSFERDTRTFEERKKELKEQGKAPWLAD